jgi:hypothetical protein
MRLLPETFKSGVFLGIVVNFLLVAGYYVIVYGAWHLTKSSSKYWWVQEFLSDNIFYIIAIKLLIPIINISIYLAIFLFGRIKSSGAYGLTIGAFVIFIISLLFTFARLWPFNS